MMSVTGFLPYARSCHACSLRGRARLSLSALRPMVSGSLPAAHLQRPTRPRGVPRHVIWIVPIAVLSLLPLIAMKLVVGGRVGQMEDKIAEAQELLLESEEKAADLDKALRNEKAQRVLAENELQKVRAEKEEHHRQIVKQMHAIGELKATSQAEKSAADAQIKELQIKLEKAQESSGIIQQQLAAERAKEKRLVGIKSDELESYHQLIVKQRKEIERKNVVIARLADDRSRAPSHAPEAAVDPAAQAAPADASTRQGSSPSSDDAGLTKETTFAAHGPVGVAAFGAAAAEGVDSGAKRARDIGQSQ